MADVLDAEAADVAVLRALEFEDCFNDSPMFRDALKGHEKHSIDYLETYTKHLAKQAAAAVSAGEEYGRKMRALATSCAEFRPARLEGYEPTPEEVKMGNALSVLGAVLESLEDHRDLYHQAIQQMFLDPLDKFRKENLGTAKTMKKQFAKASERYYSSLDRSLSSSKRRTSSDEKVDQAVVEDRQHFRQCGLNYVKHLNALYDSVQTEFAEKTLSHFYGLLTMHHQGYDSLKEMSEEMSSLAHAQQNASHTAADKMEMWSNLAKEYENKPEGHRGDSMKQRGTKEGHLLLHQKGKGAFGALGGSGWTRAYCQYNRSTGMFDAEGLVSGFCVESCVQRFSDDTDRRFCFEITSGDKTVVLQALSEDVREQWMTVMGGLMPVKTIRKKKGKLGGSKEEPGADQVMTQGFVFLQRVAAWVERHCIDEQGLYRLSGQKSKMLRLCACAETGKPLGLDDEDPTTVTSALKLYLREMPIPLMTFELHADFIRAAKVPTVEGRIAAIKESVKKLPTLNYQILNALVMHLSRVAAKSEQNKMDASNLGVVFGPTLMRPLHESVYGIMEISYQNIVVESMISHMDEIFDEHSGGSSSSSSPSSSGSSSPQAKSRAPRPAGLIDGKDLSRRPPPAVPPPRKKAPPIALTVKTLYGCSADEEGEISFEPGVLITDVEESDEDGWLLGTLPSGERGLFPANYTAFV